MATTAAATTTTMTTTTPSSLPASSPPSPPGPSSRPVFARSALSFSGYLVELERALLGGGGDGAAEEEAVAAPIPRAVRLSYRREATRAPASTSPGARTGNAETIPASHGSIASSQRAGKSHQSSAHTLLDYARNSKPLHTLLDNASNSKPPQMFYSKKDLAKQFYNVNDMAKELDILLSSIEQEAISGICKNKVEDQLMKIQELWNNKLQSFCFAVASSS
uniref:Uncharacterized protein n=1 Tax=Ananas comosus var. bracteatus TaxID=296719 RepID=A0A6V7PVZ6_ANACO|nr:unnamed protein product [Ananas comosus var. bracteatus]